MAGFLKNLNQGLRPDELHRVAFSLPPVSRRTVLGASSLVLLPSIAEAMPQATQMRVHDHGNFTRLVIELSDQVEASAFLLPEPYRLVVDLPEINWATESVLPKTALINAVRAGVFQPGQSRLVIELAQPARLSQGFLLPPTGATPWRLIVDIAPTSEELFQFAAVPNQVTKITTQGATQTQVAAKNQPPAAPREAPPQVEPKVANDKNGNRKIVVAIDPGHGGIDPGAIGIGGVYEKNITLAAAQQLKAKLEATGRYRAVLTRQRDTSLVLRQRIEIARHAPADIFISLHADSIRDKSIRGLSVYTLSEKASDAEAAQLAERENKADLIIGMDLTKESAEVRNILIDLAQRESMNLAARLAGSLITELKREVTLLRNAHRFAGFAVLKAPDIPSVLIEMGYLSNRDEQTSLMKDNYRGKLMSAVVKGLDLYYKDIQVAQRS
ncbi:MAG: N-acetylmuramoyl-L-alanine amidase [Rhodospirillaceae bacterium]|nr:N-acetylmuramoyl-L-alanine amidase [Rhodospirillaceae bacterium]